MMRISKPAPMAALPKPQVVTETAVAKATRSLMVKMDAQHAEIARLLQAVHAALA
jgi:hypothetical protein